MLKNRPPPKTAERMFWGETTWGLNVQRCSKKEQGQVRRAGAAQSLHDAYVTAVSAGRKHLQCQLFEKEMEDVMLLLLITVPWSKKVFYYLAGDKKQQVKP